MNDTAVVATGGLRDLGRAYLRRRYAILFYTLLFTMVAAPFVDAFEFPGVLIESLLAANLLAAVLPVSDRKRSQRATRPDVFGVAGKLGDRLVRSSGALGDDTRECGR